MKIHIFLFMLLGLTACASSKPSPEEMAEFRNAQTNLDLCLMDEIMKVEDGKTDQYLLARVVSSKCQYTVMKETQRLQGLGVDPYFTKGFISMYADRNEVIDRALELLIATRQGLIKPVQQGKKSK